MNQVFRRNLFGLQWGWNYETMQGLGYCYVIMPVLKLLYKNNPEKMKKALKTEMGFFNTSQPMSNLIIGADIAIQEEFGMDDPDAITSLKTGFMGPFAGVGDTIFLAIYRSIFFSIAAYMALEGNVAGLIIPILGVIGVTALRYFFTKFGYKQGKAIASAVGDQMRVLTEGASILGLTVVGALIPSVVKFALDWHFMIGEVPLSIQEQLNKIMPGMMPLLLVFFCYWLLGKKKMTSTKVMLIISVIGIIVGNLAAVFVAPVVA